MSSSKLVHTGRVRGGRFVPDNRGLLASHIKSFEGMDVQFTISKRRKRRSGDQNAYYWGVVVNMVRDGMQEVWGEHVSLEESHHILKFQCNYEERVNEATGEIIKIPKTTTELSTAEFEEYLERCRRFAQEWLQVIIPLPNEQVTFNFDELS